VGIIIAGKVLIGVAHNAAADSTIGNAGLDCLEQGDRPEKGYVVAVLAVGKIVRKTSRCAILSSQCVNAVFECLMYFCMSKNNFACRLLNVATTQAIHWFCVVVWNLLDIGVTTFAANPRMGAAIEECFIHIKQAIVALLVYAGKTPETMTHETVLCVHSVQSLRKYNYQCECKKARRKAQGQYLRVPSDATVYDR
jgi:hypothetical protein